jgi:hypothetical protein
MSTFVHPFMVVISMKRVITGNIVESAKMKMDNCEEDKGMRAKDTAFTRKSKLGAKRALHLILHRIYTSLQLAIDSYFDSIGELPVSKQAFSKARKNIRPEFIREYADESAAIAAKDETAPSYKGMKLIAIDGSDIALENSAELIEAFGCSGPNKDAATALASLAYGPLDHIIYDCRIDRYEKDERDLAMQHIERLSEIGLGGSLLLFDRWYPSAEFIAHILDRGYSFVARVRRKWSLQADAVKTQGWIRVEHDGSVHDIRVLKVRLKTGETETLLTNLNQKKLPIREAGELYFKRWGVETAYDTLKSKLQLENFSGKTKVAVLQDFYATVFLSILASSAAAVADDIIKEQDEGKDLKHRRVSNRSRAVRNTREYFLSLLMEPDRQTRAAMLETLFQVIAQRPVSVVPDRSPERKTPRKKRFHLRRKAVVG